MKKRILEKLTKRKIQVINFNDPRQEVLFVRKKLSESKVLSRHYPVKVFENDKYINKFIGPIKTKHDATDYHIIHIAKNENLKKHGIVR